MFQTIKDSIQREKDRLDKPLECFHELFIVQVFKFAFQHSLKLQLKADPPFPTTFSYNIYINSKEILLWTKKKRYDMEWDGGGKGLRMVITALI